MASPAGYAIYVHRGDRWEVEADLSAPGYEPSATTLAGAYEGQVIKKKSPRGRPLRTCDPQWGGHPCPPYRLLGYGSGRRTSGGIRPETSGRFPIGSGGPFRVGRASLPAGHPPRRAGTPAPPGT